MIKPKLLVLFLFVMTFVFLTTGIAAQDIANYKDFPLKRLVYDDGSSQCGYYDQTSKKLYGCTGKLLDHKSSSFRDYQDEYCCSSDREIITKVSSIAKNIYFNTGSSKLQKNSFDLLDELARIMRNYPELKLEINAYTDNTGAEEYNMKLSDDRASTVKNYLVKVGIDESRLEANGFGESNPIADNKTTAGRSKNKRVELKVSTDN